MTKEKIRELCLFSVLSITAICLITVFGSFTPQGAPEIKGAPKLTFYAGHLAVGSYTALGIIETFFRGIGWLCILSVALLWAAGSMMRARLYSRI